MPWIYEKPNEYVVFCFVFYIKRSEFYASRSFFNLIKTKPDI